jgi:putative hydrolase of the HAD superfamily
MGIKGFMLSAIETAIELSDGRIGATEIQELIVLGQSMLAHPVDLLDGIHEIIPRLASDPPPPADHKGRPQGPGAQAGEERASGLTFAHIEIVSEKDVMTYGRRSCVRYDVQPERFVMVGNSVKSDILPVIELGGAGVHIPYALMWGGEKVDATPTANGRFHQLKSVRELPSLLGEIVRR